MSMSKRVIFTVSKNSDIREWASYHISSGFEIYVANNGNVLYETNPMLHVIKPYISESIGHTTQQEYLINEFYNNYKDNALLFFIDDDEYIHLNTELKGNTYLNWKVFNGKYYPVTELNKYFKPVVLSNQNVKLTIHRIVSSEPIVVYDGNGSVISKDSVTLDGIYTNYIEHRQFVSVDDFNRRLLMRPYNERLKYLKLRVKHFWQCVAIPDFWMCVILDDYDKIEQIRTVYPKLVFFVCNSIVPVGADIESVPIDYWYCPERYIFQYAEKQSINVVIKRASVMKDDLIDIDDDYKLVNLYKTCHHYPILKKSKKFITRYREYGYFSFYEIYQFNHSIGPNDVYESKSFKIDVERMGSEIVKETLGDDVHIDLLAVLL